MSHRLFRFIAASALVVAFAFAAAACGGDDDTPEPPGPVDASPSGPSGTPVPTRDLGTAVPVTVVTGGNSSVLIATAPDGPYLTDPQGMTLYTTLNDAPDSGTSSCLASCASLYPPLTVDGAPVAPEGLTGTLGVITRTDAICGEPECPEVNQVTYNGLPLYTYVNDQEPGDMAARDLGGIWSIVRP
jgi:predicted lipoprotein with Yx(FWY)xxD motif